MELSETSNLTVTPGNLVVVTLVRPNLKASFAANKRPSLPQAFKRSKRASARLPGLWEFATKFRICQIGAPQIPRSRDQFEDGPITKMSRPSHAAPHGLENLITCASGYCGYSATSSSATRTRQ